MKQGDCEILTSERGTNIYVEILESGIKKQKARKKVNKLFFGWKNPLISSITGDDWAIDNYPHTPQLSSDVVLKKYYLEFNNNLVALDVLHCDEIGLYVIDECNIECPICKEKVIGVHLIDICENAKR